MDSTRGMKFIKFYYTSLFTTSGSLPLPSLLSPPPPPPSREINNQILSYKPESRKPESKRPESKRPESSPWPESQSIIQKSRKSEVEGEDRVVKKDLERKKEKFSICIR